MNTRSDIPYTTEQAGADAGRLIGWIALIAALGGLLFGYDTGIIAVALVGLGRQFGLGDTAKQLITAALIFGAMIGCLGTGPISDRWGRRRTVMLVGTIFGIGSLCSALSPSVPFLIASRLLLGLSAGSATQIVPVYIAEVAPSARRGRMVALFQLMIVSGITVAYCTGFVLGNHWRVMFALGVVPAIILLIGMIFLPESPRWLWMSGREKEAMKVLLDVRGDAVVARRELDDIRNVSDQVQSRWRDLTKPWVRPAVVVAAVLAMFTQITGNNALVYYAPTILIQAGFSDKVAVLGSGFGTVLVVIMTVVGSYLVDKVGRRRYMLWTIPGSVVALGVMGFLFLGAGPTTALSRGLAVAALGIYLMLNCGGFGVCLWLIIAEIFPLFVRGKGAAVGAFSHWIFDLLVSLTTLSLVRALGPAYTFWLYGAISVVGVLFIAYFVPETRGKTLERIEHDLREHRFYPYAQRG